MAGCVSAMDKSLGGAVSVNITGRVDNNGLPCFSSNLIHERRESLDDVPEIRRVRYVTTSESDCIGAPTASLSAREWRDCSTTVETYITVKGGDMLCGQLLLCKRDAITHDLEPSRFLSFKLIT